MPHIRKFCFGLWVLLVCGLAQADTIPTLTATYARLFWDTTTSVDSVVSGPNFFMEAAIADLNGVTYPCSLPVSPGGCVAPGPALSLRSEFFQGAVTLGGIQYTPPFVGNVQIQYLTPTIVYPDPSTSSANYVYIPVVLSGFETAYSNTYPPLSTPLANISINLPGTLTMYATEVPCCSGVYTGASFTSSPVPEPGSIALIIFGFLMLLAAGKVSCSACGEGKPAGCKSMRVL